MSIVCGERINHLVEKSQQQLNKVSQLLEKSDDEIVNKTNGY